MEYDILGRVKRQSVPTETNSSYTPTGDDSAGPLWTHLKYDWMGRVVRKINTDGIDQTTLNDSDVLISYEGCGCAGGLVTTVEGELVPRTDTTGNARRKQKSYADILGRTFKTETYEWDGTTVYSTVLQSFDGGDRPVRTRQYAGDIYSTTYQDTTATFDGHGRLASSHRPEQRDSSNNPTYTTFAYNPDDSLHIKTDARGATATMTYNSRGLVTNVANEWSSPPPPPRKNYALPANGGTGSASSVYSSSFPVASAFNGERAGIGWGSGNGGWNDSTNNSYPDWLQVDFGGEKVIDEIDVFTIQDNDTNPSAPTEAMTFTEDGIIDFDVEYWDGDSWETVPDGSVTGNNKVWRKFTFSPIATSKVRVVINYSGRPVYRYSRIAEFEAWGPDDTAPPVETSTSFSYDDLGNRISMTDEYGRMEYEYNALSQLTAETREFNVSMPSAPLPNNKFKIQYQYSLGTLKSYTDPFGQQINYGRDEMGRATAITGSSFGGVTTYAQDAERRAWGGLKAVTYTGGTDLALTYNDRMKVASMGLQKADTSYLMNKTYEYYKDGKIKFLDDAVDARFDRLNTYDHRGLISEALSGGEARGETVDEADRQTSLPYRQTYAFNAFGQMTASTNMHWGVTSWNGNSFDQETDYENNRIQKTGWEFDNDGRNTKAITDGSETILTTFDAAGRLIQRSTSNGLTRTYYDGNGKKMTSTSTFEAQKYLIRSSLLGGRVVSEVWPNGKKYRSYVKGLGNQTAVQTAYASESASLNESVLFEYSDVLGMSYRTTDKNAAAVATGDGGEGSPIETDPLGGSVGTSTPYIEIAAPWAPEPEYPELQPYNNTFGTPEMQSDFGSMYAFWGSRMADLPGFGTEWGNFFQLELQLWDESIRNGHLGLGFVPNEQLGIPPGVRITGFGIQFHDADGTIREGFQTYEDALRNSEGVGDIFAIWDEDSSWSDALFGDDALRIIGIEGDRRKQLLDALDSLVKNEECAKAFAQAGATPVATQVQEGLTVLNSELASHPHNDAQWSPDSVLGTEMRRQGGLNLLTAADVTPVGPYKGRFYVALSPNAFKETQDHFIISLIHSFLHSGGKDPKHGAFRTGRVLEGSNGRRFSEFIIPLHDLEWMGSQYNTVLEKCAPGVTSKAPPART